MAGSTFSNRPSQSVRSAYSFYAFMSDRQRRLFKLIGRATGTKKSLKGDSFAQQSSCSSPVRGKFMSEPVKAWR